MLQSITPDQLETLITFRAGVQVLDVRKKTAFERDHVIAETAEWRDPSALDAWADDLDKDRAVICYCVHGHVISQNAARALDERGFDAYYLRGGFDEWNLRSAPIVEEG